MNIVMLSWEYPPCLVGGLARHVHALARQLAHAGHKVHVLTRGTDDLPSEAMEDGVHVLRVQPYFHQPADFRLWVCHLNYALLEAGVRLLQTEGTTILHAHDWLVAYAARCLKGLFQVPLVATIHATEAGRQGGIHDPGQQYINDVEWWLTYEAWQVIVCSKAMRAEVGNLFGLGEQKLTVVPNGVDLPPEPTAECPPREDFAAPGERLLFHLGRLVPEKGAAVLLEAMPLLLRRHPVRLVIGGVGPYADDLKRRAAALGIAERVHFAGWLTEESAAALYRLADVTVVPSTYEPFGIVALEAMAAGAPLVGSDVGGLGEIIRHESNGLKAEPGDPLSLAEQIDRLLIDRPLARRLAAQGYRDVRDCYTWERVALQTETVYRQVLDAWSTTDWAASSPTGRPPTGHVEAPGRYAI